MSDRILLVGDLHLADKPPSSCTDTYLDDLFDLLNQVAELSNQAACVVFAGDIFHHKTPSRTSHQTVLRFIETLRKFKAPVFIVPGNHDMLGDRFESIKETQPLGSVFASGVVDCLDGPTPLGSKNFPIFGVPWQQVWDDNKTLEYFKGYRELLGNTARLHLMIAHAPVYPINKTNPWEDLGEAWWSERTGPGFVYFGHVHDQLGQWGKMPAMCNNGALTRGSLTESNMTRPVGITWWDMRDGTFEFQPLRYKPASEVFRLQEKVELVQAQEKLDEFLSEVGETELAVVSIEGIIAEIQAMNSLPDNLKKLAIEILEGV